jgi:hypothetical protein
MHEHILRFRPGICQLDDLAEANALPTIIETAPPRNSMEVAHNRSARKTAEFFPRQVNGILYQTKDTKIPMSWVEKRNCSFVQNWPF